MAKKPKLNLTGLKNQVKTGTVTIEYLNGKVDFPMKLKDDRTYKKIIALGDYKYKTKLTEKGLVSTTLQKITNIKKEYMDIIINSEGYSAKDVSYVKIYDENDLIFAKSDRETMFEGITVVAHMDLDFVVDDKNGTTFLDLINETFKDIIIEKFGEPISRNDYFKVTEILFEANLLSYEVINEFLVNIRSLKTGRPIEEEKYRLEGYSLGVPDSELDRYVKMRESEKKIKEISDEINSASEIVEEVPINFKNENDNIDNEVEGDGE